MIKQKVIRTYPRSFSITTEHLEEALEAGYKVKHITLQSDGIIEYIVEKQDYPTNDNINKNIKVLKEMGIVQID